MLARASVWLPGAAGVLPAGAGVWLLFCSVMMHSLVRFGLRLVCVSLFAPAKRDYTPSSPPVASELLGDRRLGLRLGLGAPRARHEPLDVLREGDLERRVRRDVRQERRLAAALGDTLGLPEQAAEGVGLTPPVADLRLAVVLLVLRHRSSSGAALARDGSC